MFLRILRSAFLVLATGVWLRASEEEILPWSEVRVVGAENKDTGTVVFSAKVAGGIYREVNLEVFGKKFAVPQEQPRKLTGLPLASPTITHEAGYERLGGHTVHFKLKHVYLVQGRLLEESLTLSVSRGKGLATSERQQRVRKDANP
jgi:hypothetical protein